MSMKIQLAHYFPMIDFIPTESDFLLSSQEPCAEQMFIQ